MSLARIFTLPRAVARTFSTSCFVGGTTSFYLKVMANFLFWRPLRIGVFSIWSMPTAQLKKPLITDQCTEKLEESPVRNGNEVRNFITRSVVIPVKSATSFFLHQSTSLSPISFGFVLVSPILDRKSSHSCTAASTVAD